MTFCRLWSAESRQRKVTWPSANATKRPTTAAIGWAMTCHRMKSTISASVAVTSAGHIATAIVFLIPASAERRPAAAVPFRPGLSCRHVPRHLTWRFTKGQCFRPNIRGLVCSLSRVLEPQRAHRLQDNTCEDE